MSDRDGGAGGIRDRAVAATTDPGVLKAVGTAALVGALVVAVAPGLLAPAPFLRVLGSELLVAPLGLLAVVLAVRAFRAGAETDAEVPATPDYETREGSDAPRVGRAIDERVERLLGDEAETETVRDGVVADVWDHLRETAVETMVAVEGLDRETAVARIEDGSWTDDPRAAAFLGGEDAPPLPVWLRIADWLRGAPSVRRIEATVEAIRRHADVERAGVDPATLDPAASSPGAEAADEEAEASVAELEAFLERAESRAATDGGDRE